MTHTPEAPSLEQRWLRYKLCRHNYATYAEQWLKDIERRVNPPILVGPDGQSVEMIYSHLLVASECQGCGHFDNTTRCEYCGLTRILRFV